MPQTLILLTCVMVLLACLLYVADMANNFVDTATQIYCEQRADFSKCSQEFKEKMSTLMKRH
jgi:hypothetical protein